MARYIGEQKNSLLDSIEGTRYSAEQATEAQPSIMGDEKSGWGALDKDQRLAIAQAAMKGGSAGGLSSMLTSGGMSAALMGAGPVGLGVAGAGLILGQIEAAQKRKAEHEQAQIQAQNDAQARVLAGLQRVGSANLGV
jgi:hypothetical protein